ncbi:hypothetical protein EW026_g4416 [Hermanssonia centrifuga]|uniref:RBR-type E3 ubiquitin transferase n=1 Tax=Hermanssonia centrifuga TaxID=98765 RepID=A0A4S4KH82_9APHY|nr:hypothetical protein EW026_g4416 [Hermanssonia centrifuga]
MNSCKQSFFVDKQEYEATNIIACPLPRCQNSWCRSCNHLIDQNGPPHSCDGTAELRHLMGQRGWKYCPGCQTPAEKVDGCNHMTCTSPGCNTHFCYLCGKAIVRSVKRQEIKDALSRHYRSCRMFEDIPDLPVPP